MTFPEPASPSLPPPSPYYPCLSPPLPNQAALLEPDRVYALIKVHRLSEAVRAINECPAATGARSLEEAKQMRVEAAPVYLKTRVESDQALPDVQVRSEEEGASGEESGEGERLRAVVGHVVKELKQELVIELAEYLRPKWSYW